MYLSPVDASAAEKARRRSVDVGGLALALGPDEGNHGSGHGWGGWDSTQDHPQFAELVSKMYNDTHSAIEDGETSVFKLPDHDIRAQLISLVGSWDFEPHKLAEEQLIYTSLLFFEALFRVDGVQEAVPISLEQIGRLLCGLRRVYRQQNSYHNFQHALDVLQATHHILQSAGRVPPVSVLSTQSEIMWSPNPDTVDPLVACLTPLDLFCLYVASIGHDAGHPGFTNMFMKNAKVPLSELYNNESPLENMHCTLLMHMLRRHGLASLIDSSNDPHSFRKLLHATVLATDMRVHTDFMTNFRRLVEGHEIDSWPKRVLLCQALIKCADISNPCRPLSVSRYWANALIDEWNAQAVLEQYLDMPVSLRPADGPLPEARSQVFFIEVFAWPLFKLAAQGIPPVGEFATQCGCNLAVWKERVDTLSTDSVADTSDTASVASSAPSQLPEDFLTAFPMTLPSSLINAEHSDRHSHSEWASVTSRGSRSSPSYTSSSRSASPSPVSSTAPAQPPALSSASTSTASGSSGTPSSPTEPPSAVPSRAVSIVSVGSGGAFTGLLGASEDGSTAAIRAAYRASVRKRPSFANRNSWSPCPRNAAKSQVPAIDLEALARLANMPTARRDSALVAVANGSV